MVVGRSDVKKIAKPTPQGPDKAEKVPQNRPNNTPWSRANHPREPKNLPAHTQAPLRKHQGPPRGSPKHSPKKVPKALPKAGLLSLEDLKALPGAPEMA